MNDVRPVAGFAATAATALVLLLIQLQFDRAVMLAV